MLPNIIAEEKKEEKFYQWVDQYNLWDTTPYTLVTNKVVGNFYIFNLDNPLFNLTKIKRDGTSKTRVVSKLS